MSAEILRTSKATTRFQDFMKSTKILLDRILKQYLVINNFGI